MEFDVLEMALAQVAMDHLKTSLTAVGLALIPAFPLGWAAARSSFLYQFFGAMLRFVWAVPLFGAMGLVLALFPDSPTVAFGLFLVFCALLPLCYFMAQGIRHIDETALEACRAMGLSEGRLFWIIKVPGMLPSLVEGLRIASLLTVSLTAVAGAFGIGGLGQLIMVAMQDDRLDIGLVGSLALCAMALALNYSFKLIYWRLTRHESTNHSFQESTPLLG